MKFQSPPLRSLCRHFSLFLCLAGALHLFALPPLFSDDTPASSVSHRGKAAVNTSADSHPAVTLVEFSDFKCPYCAKMVPVLDEIMSAYPGKVRLIVRDFPLPIHPGSELAHEACLAAKAQGKYWEMYHLLFANQQHLSKADLLNYANQVHLDAVKFERALDTHQYRSQIEESSAEGLAIGVTATPTFFFNGRKLQGAQSRESLAEQIEQALGSKPRKASPEPAVENGLQLDSPVRGSPDAPITITEYADFQCPYCANARSKLDQVLREYPHQVKLVFKSFPLDFHPDSILAHRAALAAQKQGKFWEMHDLIFSSQRAMKHDDLFAMAKSLGLDTDRFASDLQDPAIQSEIDAQQREGKRLGVNGTPTFYIDGQEMVGAASVDQFESLITRALVAKGLQPVKTPIEADKGPTRGPEHAPVTVVWYSDVTSPLEITADHLVDQLLDAYPNQVRIVYKNRPLEFHHDAALAHQALAAAAAQGQFWQMHRALLAHQHALSATDIVDYAASLGLDTKKFLADLTSESSRDSVQRDISQAREAGINGVPSFFVNGTRIDGVQPFSSFKAIVDDEIKKTRVAAVHE